MEGLNAVPPMFGVVLCLFLLLLVWVFIYVVFEFKRSVHSKACNYDCSKCKSKDCPYHYCSYQRFLLDREKRDS